MRFKSELKIREDMAQDLARFEDGLAVLFTAGVSAADCAISSR